MLCTVFLRTFYDAEEAFIPPTNKHLRKVGQTFPFLDFLTSVRVYGKKNHINFSVESSSAAVCTAILRRISRLGGTERLAGNKVESSELIIGFLQYLGLLSTKPVINFSV